LDATIDRLFPEHIGEEDDRRPTADHSASSSPSPEPPDVETLRATATGFIESVDPDAVLEAASGTDLVVRLTRRPGDFVVEGSELMRVWPCGRIDATMRHRLLRTISLASRRSPTQDVEFALQQLVEVALRALSPASNDPFTAIDCVERLGAALVRLGRRRIPSHLRFDYHGHLRVIATPSSYSDIVNTAFDQIRRNAREDVAVTARILQVFAEVGACGVDPRMSRALLAQAESIERASRAADLDPRDLQDLARRFAAARDALVCTPDTQARSVADAPAVTG
jgi:uncharacterized membrane protein